MRHHSGFSLHELLVSLAVGSLAITGTLSAFAAGRAALHQAQSVNRLQERALYVLSVLEPELQLAGGYGLTVADRISTAAVGNSASGCGAGLAQNLTVAVEASTGHWPLTCAAAGGGWVAGTDVLIVRRAAIAAATPDAGRLQLLTSTATPAVSTLLANGTLPAGTVLLSGHTELHDLLVRCYYIARRADGSNNALPALRVKSLTRYAGSPAFIDTEVLPGVSGLQVLLGYQAAAGAPVHFVRGDALPAGAHAVAVQLQLQLTGHRSEVGTTAADNALHLTRSITLRNASRT